MVENRSDAYQATATDPEGNALTFSITGGADAGRFTISSSGLLRFVTPPDFEVAVDADADNLYLVEIGVSDGQTSRMQAVQITVTNDREGISVRRVASGLTHPVYLAPIPGDARVFVAQKGGNIVLLDPSTGASTLFLSVIGRADPIGGGFNPDFSSDGERGLLAVAAAPDYQTSGYVFVFMTVGDGDIEIRRYRRSAAGVGDPRSMEVLLRIEHSQFNNNYGGWLGFGPDGNLYIATGDGGGAGDPQGNAQNRQSLLGKILRLMPNPDPNAGASPGPSWIAHSGNPFYNSGGAREVFAYGLRNPYRASFSSNALLIGDIGEKAVEEVDLLPIASSGLNFGWPFKEGTQIFAGPAPTGLTDPVTQYPHGNGRRQGTSVIAGLLYRGSVQALSGRYLFADAGSRNIWSVPTNLLQQGAVLGADRYELRNADFTPDTGAIDQPVALGEDAAGNLFIVDADGEVFQVT